MLDGVGISWLGGSPENTGLIVAVIVAAYFLVLWISAVLWTARDIHQRTADTMTQIIYALIVLLFNFPGLVVYRVLRPPMTLQEAEEHRLESAALTRELEQMPPCPRCAYEILPDYLACPRCALPLRTSCGRCERVLDPDWQICPWCVTAIQRSGRAGGDDLPASGATPRTGDPRDRANEAANQQSSYQPEVPVDVHSARVPTVD